MRPSAVRQEPGATVAVGALGRSGLVSHGRGFVRVDSAAGLGAASCGCYRVLADEYGNFINDLAGLQSFPTYRPAGRRRL